MGRSGARTDPASCAERMFTTPLTYNKCLLIQRAFENSTLVRSFSGPAIGPHPQGSQPEKSLRKAARHRALAYNKHNLVMRIKLPLIDWRSSRYTGHKNGSVNLMGVWDQLKPQQRALAMRPAMSPSCVPPCFEYLVSSYREEGPRLNYGM